MEQKLMSETVRLVTREQLIEKAKRRLLQKPTTLAEAFYHASKELKQLRGSFGLRSKKAACARGVINYYFGTAENLSHETTSKAVGLIRQADKILREKTGYDGLITLNDHREMRWTFRQFATFFKKEGM